MTASAVPVIGVIGLGAMGNRAAARSAQEHQTYGYDLDDGACNRAAEQGVMAAASAAEVAAAADLIVLSLPMPDDDSGAASASNLFRELAPKILAGDFSPTFGLGLLAKDNRLAMELADQVGSPSFVGNAVHLVNGLAVNGGLAGEDTGAVYKLYGAVARQEDPRGSA